MRLRSRLKSELRYYYDDWIHLLPDVDGVRLLTNDVCEFLQKVPGMAIKSIVKHAS